MAGDLRSPTSEHGELLASAVMTGFTAAAGPAVNTEGPFQSHCGSESDPPGCTFECEDGGAAVQLDAPPGCHPWGA